MSLQDRELTVGRKKDDSRCDVLLSAVQELRHSMPTLSLEEDDQNKPPLRLSIRHHVEEWLDAFHRCMGVTPPPPSPDLLTQPTSTTLGSVTSPTLSLSSPRGPQEPPPAPPLVPNWDEELSRKLRSSRPPPPKILLSESVHVYCFEQHTWYRRLIKLDSGILHMYKALHGAPHLQAMIYLAGCQVQPLDAARQPLPSSTSPSAVILRIHRTTPPGPVMSQFSPAGAKLPDYSESSYVDMQFRSAGLLQSATDALEKAIAMNVAPLESLVPVTPQQRAALYACDYAEMAASPRTLQPVGQAPLLSLNLLLSRYLLDVQSSSVFHHELQLFVSHMVHMMHREPEWLSEWNVHHMDISTLAFDVIDVQCCRFSERENEVVCRRKKEEEKQ